jgi:hypothetical protein
VDRRAGDFFLLAEGDFDLVRFLVVDLRVADLDVLRLRGVDGFAALEADLRAGIFCKCFLDDTPTVERT